MSRSCYVEDIDNDWSAICWRGAVASSIRGARGQAFLRELLVGLDAMPVKELIREYLVNESGEVCAIGVVGRARGLDMLSVDQDDPQAVGSFFGIAGSLAAEIEYINDDWWLPETTEERWKRVRKWVVENIKTEERCERAELVET